MARDIIYYFSIISPWAYLGSPRLHAIAQKHGARIVYRPCPLGTVFSKTGGLPLSQRPPARQAYRFMEMQRWRDELQMPLTLKPKFFPLDIALADRAALALLAMGAAPRGYIEAAHLAIWAQDRNLADEAEIAAVLTASGHDAQGVLALARTQAMGEAYAANGATAIETGVFGSPSYVLDGEIYWGQDRLPQLANALASGRAPYA